MATSTKTTRKPAKSAKRNAPAAKRAAKKATPKQTQPRKTAQPKQAPRRETSDRDRTAAQKATAMMRKNTDGVRAPVNATQVALVRSVVGRRSIATVAKSLGFSSKAQLVKHASGELDSLPTGAATLLATFNRELGGVSGASKIRGRKLTAIIASL